jgi:hypothetical protein
LDRHYRHFPKSDESQEIKMKYKIGSFVNIGNDHPLIFTENNRWVDIFNLGNLQKELAVKISGEPTIEPICGLTKMNMISDTYMNGKRIYITDHHILMFDRGYDSEWYHFNSNDLETYGPKDTDYYRFHFNLENAPAKFLEEFIIWVRDVAVLVEIMPRRKAIHRSAFIYEKIMVDKWVRFTFDN